MKTLLFLTVTALVTTAVARRLVPAERRAELRESLVQMPGTVMERCMEAMPEDSPPKAMMSSMRQLEAQNDELVALLREQNKLLKKQNDILQEAAAAVESQG